MVESCTESCDSDEFARKRSGVILACVGALFVGCSIVRRKYEVCQKDRKSLFFCGGALSWGLVLAGIGGTFNFAAFSLAPPTLVCALDVLSLVVSVIVGACFGGPDERLGFKAYSGVALCIVGAVLVAVYSPCEHTFDGLGDILGRLWNLKKIFTYVFIAYAALIPAAIIWGYNIVACSLAGAINVVSIKTVGVAFGSLNSENTVDVAITLSVAFVLSGLLVFVQVYTLNAALKKDAASRVAPLHHVIAVGFTTLMVVLLYGLRCAFKTMDDTKIALMATGLVIIACGVYLASQSPLAGDIVPSDASEMLNLVQRPQNVQVRRVRWRKQAIKENSEIVL